VGSVSAQVTITGGLDFTYGKSGAYNNGTVATPASLGAAAVPAVAGAPTPDGSVSRGVYNTDAYIDLVVSEDLGNGTMLKGSFEFNADGGWGSGMYAGDKSIAVSFANGVSLGVVSTRSGGILDRVLFAPEVNPDDHWGATGKKGVAGQVLSRGGVDALAVSYQFIPAMKLGYKYVEQANDGQPTPTLIVHTIGGYYNANSLKIEYEYNILMADGLGDVRTGRHDLTGTYDWGFVKAALGYESGGLATPNATSAGTAAGALFASVVVPVGNLSLGANWGKRDAANFYEVGATYNFSKQTYLTASYGGYTNVISNAQALLSNEKAGSTWNTDSYGIRVGKNF
jgi:hypothetical protein